MMSVGEVIHLDRDLHRVLGFRILENIVEELQGAAAAKPHCAMVALTTTCAS